ncbi:MAG: hypothetical protein ABI407_05670, partial [Bradyrhizobium sp.]
LYPSLFGGKPDKLYLVKRASKTKPEPVYITLSVEQLREIADTIEHGKRQCAAFIIWLRLRDIPIEELPKGYGIYGGDPMPEPLEIPARITGSRCPCLAQRALF